MNRNIILASGSPRRKELLTQSGFEFEVITADADEKTDEKIPEKYVLVLSQRKAEAVFNEIKREDSIVIGADTVVCSDNEILLKPKNREEAVKMITKLQGSTHQVYTGVTIIWKDNSKINKIKFTEKTDVTFFKMTEKEIFEYVNTGEGDDKAGAYAIQGIGMKFIKCIKGDYHNVVGLPVGHIYQELYINNLIN